METEQQTPATAPSHADAPKEQTTPVREHDATSKNLIVGLVLSVLLAVLGLMYLWGNTLSLGAPVNTALSDIVPQ